MYGKVDVSLEQYPAVTSGFGEFTTDTYYSSTQYMEFKPREVSKFVNILYPLDRWCWLFLLVSILAMSAALYVSRTTMKYESVSR